MIFTRGNYYFLMMPKDSIITIMLYLSILNSGVSLIMIYGEPERVVENTYSNWWWAVASLGG